MSNIFIGDRNHADAATLSGGSWLADAPLANVANPDVTASARAADALTTSTIIQWDNASAKTHQAVALINHNLGSTAQLKLSLGTTAGASDVYAGSWVDAWHVTSRAATGLNFPAIIVLPSAPSARYGKLEIDDTTNADGYVEIGRLVVCDGFSPAYNAESGLTHGWQDTSSSARTQGGRRQAISGRAYRVAEFALPVLTEAEADAVHDLQLVCRTTEGVLYLPTLRDVEQCQRYGVWGVLTDLAPATWRFVGARGVRFRVEEL